LIQYVTGDLLSTDVEALVNTVNTVGIMGKGIALQFKNKFPYNYIAYQRACHAGEVNTGSMFIYQTNKTKPQWIINFPTKQHWRHPTRISYIIEGLTDLVRVIDQLKIKSIALPHLGCGCGGLSWDSVQPLIERYLGDIADVQILVYGE
jgi:O-acetyl-ADP-ribose deacetylase (regulator of RNase III)